MPTLAANAPAVTNEFIAAYDSTSGAFTQAQPSFSNISGLLINSQLPTSAVTPGSYTNANITVNAQGIVTSAANGSGGGSSITVNGGSALGSPANFISSSAVDGITLVASNPTANNVTFTLSGALTNAGLANSSITVSGASCVLGASCTVAYSGLSGLPTLPANTPAVSNEVLTAYNSTSGAFTQAALAYSSLTGLPSLEYQTIAASGTSLTQEPKLNFIEGTDSIITCVDNPSALRTDCTFAVSTGSFGNVSNSGTPASPQLAQWVSSTAIQGISMVGGGSSPLGINVNGSLTNGQIICVSGGIAQNCNPGIPIIQESSGWTVANSARATLGVISSGSAITATLPALSVLPNNYFADYYNVGAGTAQFSTSALSGVYINCSASGTATSQNVPSGWWSVLYNDGSNYCMPTMPTMAAFPNTGTNQALAFNSSTGVFSAVATGAGSVNSGTSGQLAGYTATGTVVSGLADLLFTESGSTSSLTIGTSTVAGTLTLTNTSSQSMTIFTTGSGLLGLGSNATISNAGALTVTSCSGCGALFPQTVGGTVASGGIPYFNSSTQESSSALLVSGALMLGGGIGAAPYTVADLEFSSSGSSDLLIIGLSGSKNGELVLNSAGGASGQYAILPGSITSAMFLTLPPANGSNGNSLLTDGSGHSSWGLPTTRVCSVTPGSGDQVTGAATFTSTCTLSAAVQASLQAGSTIDIVVDGVYTSTSGTPKMGINVNAGGTNSICSGGNITLTNTASGTWTAECRITIGSPGSSGTAYAQGVSEGFSSTASDGRYPYSNGTSSQTYNTSVAETVSVHQTFALISGETMNLTSLVVYVNP